MSSSLRPIAVADGDLPTLFDHTCDVHAVLARRRVLIRHALMRFVIDERITPDTDDGNFVVMIHSWASPDTGIWYGHTITQSNIL
jgi:hypothetical protein